MAEVCRACGGYHRLDCEQIEQLVEQSLTARGAPWRPCRCPCCADWGMVIPSALRRAFVGFHLEVLGGNPPGWLSGEMLADAEYMGIIAARLSDEDRGRFARLLSPMVRQGVEFAEFEAVLAETALHAPDV
jgi:hypothetical protein